MVTATLTNNNTLFFGYFVYKKNYIYIYIYMVVDYRIEREENGVLVLEPEREVKKFTHFSIILTLHVMFKILLSK